MLLATVAPTFWIAFFIGVAVLLALDMFVFHRHSHEPTLKESALWTLFWTGLALAFNAWVWHQFGTRKASEFLTGYLVEWSLSMDNVFVFVVIFGYFGVPLKYQYRVLFWGILGAIVMRLTFILAAAALLEKFHWVMYFFGAFLLYTGIKLARNHGAKVSPDDNPIVRFARKRFRVTETLHGDRFFVVENGRRAITPLFLVLLVVESTDVVFAIDSVPAIFGVTKDPFIVFTSNVFAIMGLRALYFLLAGVIQLFRYLHYGLAAVLCFIGLKMLLKDFWHDQWHVPHWVSLVVIASLLGLSIAASLLANWKSRRTSAAQRVEIIEEEVKAAEDHVKT